MRFSAERDVLAAAASKVAEAKGNYSWIHCGEGEVTLVAVTADLAIETRVEANVDVAGGSSVAVSSATFAKMVASVEAGQVEVVLEDGASKLGIVGGSVAFSLSTAEGDEAQLPELEDGGVAVEVPSDDLAAALAAVSLAASSDTSRPTLTGIQFESGPDGLLRVVATDSYRLGWRRVRSGSWQLRSVIIPARAADLIENMAAEHDRVDISIDNTRAQFRAGPETVQTTLVDGDFPNYESLVPQTFSRSVTLDRAELLEALKRLQVVVDRQSLAVKVTVDANPTVFVRSATQDLGDGMQEIDPADATGDPVATTFNARYLRQGLEAFGSDQITLSFSGDTAADAAKKATVMTDPADPEGGLYLLMPIRETR